MPARSNGVVPKYFDFECRVKGAKYRRVLGRWPGVSLQDARRIASNYRNKINQGIDPFKLEAERASAKAAAQAVANAEMDFGGLVDRYFHDHAIPGQKADSSIAADRRNLRNHIPADWYARKLSNFERSDFENLRSHIRGNAETKIVRGRERSVGGPIIANRVMALLSKMMNLAIAWGALKGANPAKGIGKFKEHQRTDIFTDDELTRLDLELAKEPLPWQRYLGLVLNTATRKSECLKARWENVDLKENVVTIPHVSAGRIIRS
jgi:integrase